MLTLADSYKYGHFNSYPKDMIGSHFYMEARKCNYPKVVFFGLQYYLAQYLHNNAFYADVATVMEYAQKHGIPFNLADWNNLVYTGAFPIRIIAKPEGSICDIHEPLLTVESTDERFAWLPGFIETLLVKLWYPCTIATKAWSVKQMLMQYGPEDWADYAYHNFGDRGSSSVESALIGGMAHLLFFKGTDNFNTVANMNRYYPKATYDRTIHAHSIPATEHSVMTAYGKEGEFTAIMNFIMTHAGKYPVMACVMDSYNINHAVDYATNAAHPVRQCLEVSKSILVLRPDSGDPLTVLKDILGIMGRNEVPYTTENGLHLFTNYRILWGDGITPDTIEAILKSVTSWGFSPKNFAFGSGGDLMQNCNRDTLGFAYKLSAVRRSANPNNSLQNLPQGYPEWIGVCKDPVADSSKKSRAGLQKINDGVLVYENGKLMKEYSFEEVRKRANGN